MFLHVGSIHGYRFGWRKNANRGSFDCIAESMYLPTGQGDVRLYACSVFHDIVTLGFLVQALKLPRVTVSDARFLKRLN